MKYSKIKPMPNFTKHIDSFKGVNSANALEFVGENQLSEAVNIWSPDGSLKNRPGLLNKNSVLKRYDREYNYLRAYERNLPPFKALDYCKIGAICEARPSGHVSVCYYLSDKNGNRKMLEWFTYSVPSGGSMPNITNIMFVFGEKIMGSGIFTVLTVEVPTETAVERKIFYFELDSNFEKWIEIDKKKFYTPVILRYGKGNNYAKALELGRYVGKDEETLEEINIVNGAFSAYYSCDGLSDTFYLPYNKVSMQKGEIVKIEYALSIAETKSVVFGENENYKEIDVFGKTVGIELDRVNGKFFFTHENEPYGYPITKSENVLKVTAYKYDNDKAYELFSSNVSEIYFDDRLLRVGNFNSCNRLFYSGKDNHFYFNESASIPVGEKMYALTAVASQNRYLFLFKENEIYRLRMEESGYYDINEIINNKLKADLKTLKYTLMTVNSSIGCDCPKSIAFCTNRLVWYNSDGFVYCLYGTNSYTEGSVYVLSDDIANSLKEKPVDKTLVTATAFEGYYFLYINNKIYVMDALISGFRYLSGMKNTASKNGSLNWFVWEMPENVWLYSIYAVASKLYAVVGSIGKSYCGEMYITEFCEEKNTDSVFTDYDVCKEKPISVQLSSALISPDKRNCLLKKISVDMENKNYVTANIFTKTKKGENFLIKNSNGKKSVYIPPFLCTGAGITLKTTAPVTVNGLDFEFYLKG